MTAGQLSYIASLLICHRYGMLTPFMFTSILVGYFFSVFRYGEEVNYICLGGAAFIVVGIVFIVRSREKE